MRRYDYRILEGTGGLLAVASAWNELWQQSDARQPTVRVEGICAWLDAFGDGRQFKAVCVEEAGRLVAALPLLDAAKTRRLTPARLPTNCWANAGDLLLGPDADPAAAMERLADGVAAAGMQVLMLEEIGLDRPSWQTFAAEIERRGGSFYCRGRSRVGVVDILHDWDRYQQSWSGNHRSAVRRSYKKLCQAGEVRTERFSSIDDPLEELLLTAFEIEDRSWKGEAGTSVLQTPGMFEYIVAEAQQMARAGHLDLWLLYLDDQPLAFEYCHTAKGVCFSHKIGYDAEYARFGPGRLLRFLQMETLHADPTCRQFDMLGNLCSAKAKWATSTYDVANCLAAIDGPAARLAVSSYGRCRDWIRGRRGSEAPEELTLGAAGCLETPAARETAAGVA